MGRDNEGENVYLIRVNELEEKISRLDEEIFNLKDELKILRSVEKELGAWSKLEGEDLCWHHPDILKKLCAMVGIKIKVGKCLPTKENFESGCVAYIRKLYKEEE